MSDLAAPLPRSEMHNFHKAWYVNNVTHDVFLVPLPEPWVLVQ